MKAKGYESQGSCIATFAVETSYVYDPLGRKTSQTERDTGTTGYQYNAIGEVIVQTDFANHRIERHLDARGRLWRERSYRWGGGGHSLESTRQFVFDTLARGAHPTDSRLLEIARHHVVKAAKAAGIRLKQTFAADGKTRRRKAGGYAHARQFKRLRKAVYIDVVIVFPPTFVVASELDVAGTFRRLNMDFQSGEYATVLAPQRIPPSRHR